jgi:hypothetical protein
MVFGSMFGDFTQHHKSEKKKVNGKNSHIGEKKTCGLKKNGHIFYIMEIIVLKT